MNNSQSIIDEFDGRLDSSIWSLKRIEPKSYEFSEKLKVSGTHSLKITVHKEDKKDVGNNATLTERAELMESDNVVLGLENDIWYQYYVYFPEDFLIIDNRLVFSQWKQYKTEKLSPFLCLKYENGFLKMKVVSEDDSHTDEHNIDLRGKWNLVTVNYKLNKNQTGYAYMWLNNDLLFRYKGKMGYPMEQDITYFKLGLYRDSIEQTQSVCFDKYQRTFDRLMYFTGV